MPSGIIFTPYCCTGKTKNVSRPQMQNSVLTRAKWGVRPWRKVRSLSNLPPCEVLHRLTMTERHLRGQYEE